ncbi:MAG: hypothetical protein M3O36_01900 [Myxococcota bacterium]|nr:hypothetical protein [Myxococcota bacterium]
MLKFEFVVTGTELTDSQKKRITCDFPALVSKALATEDVEGCVEGPARFWCMCKVNGRSIFAHEHQDQAVDLGEPKPKAVRAGAPAEPAEMLVFETV